VTGWEAGCGCCAVAPVTCRPASRRCGRPSNGSYQLLEPDEQRLFDLLSVFSGTGFEAVETVAAELDRLTGAPLDVLDGLASLVDKSLVRRDDAGAEEPRVVMLETIREYAAERLDDRPELAASARRAHAAYFADFARRQWEHLTGRRRGPALATMTIPVLRNLASFYNFRGEFDSAARWPGRSCAWASNSRTPACWSTGTC
jgi:predicted ATPase